MENMEKLIGKVIQGVKNRYYIVDCKKIGPKYYCWTINVTDLSIEEKEDKIFEVRSMPQEDIVEVKEYEGENAEPIFIELLENYIKRQEALQQENTRVPK